MKVSVDMLHRVEAMEESTTKVPNRPRAAVGEPIRLMPRMLRPTPRTPSRYQRLGDRVVSTSGAHNTFQTWGALLRLMTAPTAATLMPRWARR